jgi:hypothetical protein
MYKSQPGVPETNRMLSTEGALVGVFFILAGISGALLMTFGGLQWLLAQIALAGDLKSGFVTTVLGLGLVLLGPILLLAVAVILPQWWFRSLWLRLRGLACGDVRGNKPADR